MEYEIETLWESKDKTLDGKPFMSVKKARGYYYYGERGGVDSIAVILYDNNTEKFGLLRESKPPLDEYTGSEATLITAAGGSIDCDIPYEQICKIEVEEEFGYDVPIEHIAAIGSTMGSTQLSEMVRGYIVDVTNIKRGHDGEDGSDLVWFSHGQVMENSDWKSIWIMGTAIYKDLV